MEELDLNDEIQEAGGIPKFLKVLCILTFIGSGLGLLGAISGFFTESFTRESMQTLENLDMSDTPFDMGTFNIDEMMKWQRYANIGNLIGCALCLTGAVMMWRLRRIGYFLYIPGVLIPFIIGMISINKMLSGMMADFGMIGIVINGLIAAAFITMYGLNYKHLN